MQGRNRMPFITHDEDRRHLFWSTLPTGSGRHRYHSRCFPEQGQANPDRLPRSTAGKTRRSSRKFVGISKDIKKLASFPKVSEATCRVSNLTVVSRLTVIEVTDMSVSLLPMDLSGGTWVRVIDPLVRRVRIGGRNMSRAKPVLLLLWPRLGCENRTN